MTLFIQRNEDSPEKRIFFISRIEESIRKIKAITGLIEEQPNKPPMHKTIEEELQGVQSLLGSLNDELVSSDTTRDTIFEQFLEDIKSESDFFRETDSEYLIRDADAPISPLICSSLESSMGQPLISGSSGKEQRTPQSGHVHLQAKEENLPWACALQGRYVNPDPMEVKPSSLFSDSSELAGRDFLFKSRV